MAERRMFAKTIVLSDAFLDMPSSARCLYFTLGMFADDDGFVNSPKGIMRQCGASDGDMQILLDKKFVLLFESGVIVIKHWRIHNYIQKDRYKPTKYTEEMALLTVDEKDGYSLIKTENSELEKIPLSDRQKAYEESELPYSFDYKIRNYFVGKTCPVCGATMSYSNNLVQPTIQHNIPISKGGKHEIGNISVICRSCNASIKDNPTGELNAEEVAKAWDEISCIHSVSKVDTQVKLSKVKLSKDNIKTIAQNDAQRDTQNTANAELIDASDLWFDAFWKVYPKKVNKKPAYNKFRKVCKDEKTFNEIMTGLKAQVQMVFSKRERKYIPAPDVWLNQERWTDEVEPEVRTVEDMLYEEHMRNEQGRNFEDTEYDPFGVSLDGNK